MSSSIGGMAPSSNTVNTSLSSSSSIVASVDGSGDSVDNAPPSGVVEVWVSLDGDGSSVDIIGSSVDASVLPGISPPFVDGSVENAGVSVDIGGRSVVGSSESCVSSGASVDGTASFGSSVVPSFISSGVSSGASVDAVPSVVSSGPSPDGSSTQPSPEQAVIWTHSDSCSSSPPSEVSESWQSATSSHLDFRIVEIYMILED